MISRDPWGRRERCRGLIVLIAIITAILLLILATDLAQAAPTDAPAGYETVPGRIISAGYVYRGRQHICYTRSDARGFTCVTVSVPRGAPWRRGDSITIYRRGGRVIGYGR